MGSRRIQVDQPVIDQFPVFNFGGMSKKSGLVQADFNVTIWNDAVVQAAAFTISEIGSSGEYKISFTPDMLGLWVVEVEIPFNFEFWAGYYDVVEGTDSDIFLLVKRILGLSHENFLIDNTDHDADGQLISARVRIFASKADTEAATDGGTSPPDPVPEATYTVTTIWEGINRFQIFRQVLEP